MTTGLLTSNLWRSVNCSRLSGLGSLVAWKLGGGANSSVTCHSLLYNNNNNPSHQSSKTPDAFTHQQRRSHYTFSFPNQAIRYRRATRPRKSNNESTLLNYEQAQFAEKIGVTKSWNSWNTCKNYSFFLNFLTAYK